MQSEGQTPRLPTSSSADLLSCLSHQARGSQVETSWPPEKAAGRGACALCPPVNRCSQALRAEEQGRDRLCTAVVACPEGLPGAGPGPGPQRIRSHLGLSARSSRPSVLKTDFPLTTRHCGRQKGMTEEAQGFHLGFGGSY